jgi:hypothetical protein
MEEPKLVDFFAVVGRSSSLAGRPTVEQINQVHTSTTPNGIQFAPCILTQFPPAQKEQISSIDPKAICQFCFPRGLKLSSSEQPPTHFTSVLTDGTGRRHYVFVLTMTEQLTTLQRTLLFLGVKLPQNNTAVAAATATTTTTTTTTANDTNIKRPNPKWLMNHKVFPVYSPRALCIVSKYPFLRQFDSFLKQLVRIALSSAPVPIERYIANFCAETPVPPRGMTSVHITVADIPLHFQRPPPNNLPMIDTNCFLLLFRSLNIKNIIKTWSLLMCEQKIVLCSASISILTPVALALVSLLFPFSWCGIFIPVLPETLIDVLDAPVPFLVGYDADYLRKTPSEHRPEGVIFINLDANTIELGYDAETKTKRISPVMPKHDYNKLSKHLHSLKEQLPDCTQYTHGPSSDFSFVEKVNGFGGATVPCVPKLIENFAIESGVITQDTSNRSRVGTIADTEESTLFTKRANSISSKRSNSLPLRRSGMGGSVGYGGNSITEDERNLPIGDIRAGFLRFQTSVFKNYRLFIIEKEVKKDDNSSSNSNTKVQQASTTELFDSVKFVNQFDRDSQFTMFQIIKTQLWSAFLQNRIDEEWEEGNATIAGDAVRYFDEQIKAKMNRSISLFSSKKKTPFLNDNRWEVTDSFTVPLPSTLRLPKIKSSSSTDDTRYTYAGGRFPEILKDTDYGSIRKPRQLTKMEKVHDATTGAMKNVLQKINSVHHVGRRMTRSDFNQNEINELENNEKIKRLSHIDFTNGYGDYNNDVNEVKHDDGKDEDDNKDHYQNDDIKQNSNNKKKESKRKKHSKGSDYEDTAKSIIIIQKIFRGNKSRNKYKRMKKIIELTRYSQAKIIQNRWKKHVYYKQCLIKIQSIFRSIPIRHKFIYIKYCLIIPIQSILRGNHCRELSMNIKKNEIIRLRKQIVVGWNECYVPLLQRSRFWMTLNMNNPTYLDIGIHYDEVRWIQKMKKRYGLVSGSSGGSGSKSGGSKSGGSKSGGSKSNGERKKSFFSSSTSTSFSSTSIPTPRYPNESLTLEDAKKALISSRKDLYWRLKGKKGKHTGLTKLDLNEKFIMFNINKEKKRKRKLSNIVWNDNNMLDDSEQFNRINTFCTHSSNVVLACIEDTDEDWSLRWRMHRIRVNVLESLRASLVALQNVKQNQNNGIKSGHRGGSGDVETSKRRMMLMRNKRKSNQSTLIF